MLTKPGFTKQGLSEPGLSEPGLSEQGLLEHGGRLRQAASTYARPLDDWLDLSTGINPNGWPVPVLPGDAWSRLPEPEDGLLPAARRYYGARHVLAVAGSQAAIQALPRLRPTGRAGVLSPAYAEHAHAWRAAGHTVTPLQPDGLMAASATLDVMVLVHPNNPTGVRFERDELLRLRARLARRGGWLLIDEAFMDATPEHSLASDADLSGLIVLRSLGKFFGLAGARVGFVLAEAGLLNRLDGLLGPWTVTGPSRFIATRALSDRDWQAMARAQLVAQAERLHTLLCRHGLEPHGGSTLFQWVRQTEATAWYEQLAQQGILVRLFGEPAALRFGLPGNESEWQRLEQALGLCCKMVSPLLQKNMAKAAR